MAAGRTHIPVISHDRCAACFACIRACPAWVFRDLAGEEESLRGVVARGVRFPAPDPGSRYLEAPPCVAACPLSQDVPGYLGAIAAGDVERAREIVLETNPLPSILGRVCPHPCTKACLRGKIDESPDIRGIKHFAASWSERAAMEAPGGGGEKPQAHRSVAIVGGGPAGLAAASILARAGLKVTLYERRDLAGGNMRYGVGEFDLPLEDLERDLGRIAGEGVEMRTGVEVRSLGEVEAQADAVLVATGSSAPGRPPMRARPNLEGAFSAASFMSRVREGRLKAVGGNVVVEGYGPWAVTAARAALRLGAKKVVIVSPFTIEKEGGDGGGPGAAISEGAEVISPARVISILRSGGRISDLKCERIRFKRIDVRGRQIGGQPAGTFKLKASIYIDARDTVPDCSWIFDGGEVGRGSCGTVVVDPATLMTGRRLVFAAGDVVTGPRSVLSAAAMGLKAARGIIKMLGGIE